MKFKCILEAYDSKSRDSELSLDELRYNIFISSPKMDLRLLPPSKNALKLHILRGAYQAGWIWGNSISEVNPPMVTDWGWTASSTESGLKVLWQPPELNFSKVSALILTVCKCRHGSTSKCKACGCWKAGLQCMKSCNCNQSCF